MRREAESMAEAHRDAVSLNRISKKQRYRRCEGVASPTLIVPGITASYLLDEYHCRRWGLD